MAQARFADVFAHLGLITAYARRRGAADPDAIAAEAMAIAWRRLADVPVDDARPWLIATARNLLLAERRKRRIAHTTLDGMDVAVEDDALACGLDPEVEKALRRLSEPEREGLLLVAWEDLTTVAAATSLGISRAAFRVRLHRARRRLAAELRPREGAPRSFTSPDWRSHEA
jgi:RNA polymerase sigma factor (sigma-70 family)